MANRRGPLLPLLLVVSVVSVVSGVADAVLVTSALDDLASGPSRAGFSLLAHAINLAIGAAALICVTSVTAAMYRDGSGWSHGFVMLLSSGFTASIALGLFGVGSAFAKTSAGVDADLYSMALALRGVGLQLRPVPVLFVASAVLVWISPFLRTMLRWRNPSTDAGRAEQRVPDGQTIREVGTGGKWDR
jgi:hypothetical protein